MELIDWNRGLLHGSALVVIGAMAIVAGRSVRDRLFSVGILVQGVAIFLVAGLVGLDLIMTQERQRLAERYAGRITEQGFIR